jgi:hypothetical protein
MPDDALAAAAMPRPATDTAAFMPRALRTAPAERHLVEALAARVLATHPAWPWPLIEREACRRAEALLAISRDGEPQAS